MKETLKKTIVFIGVPVFLASMLSVVAVNADISDHAKDESGLSAAVSTGGVPASNDVCFDNISLYSVSGGETLMAEDELIDEITNEAILPHLFY